MSTPFLGVYRALYDYAPQNEEELAIFEGDLLYLIQKSDFDEWWTVKRRVVDANEDEPQGLVPSTYIEPAQTVSTAKALFDYTKQTEEEISFQEGAVLNVYDTSDPNWTLVNVGGQQFGFVPANYIEIQTGNQTPAVPAQAPAQTAVLGSPASTLPTPKVDSFPPPPVRQDRVSPTPERDETRHLGHSAEEEEEEEEEAPPMPSRPRPTTQSTTANASRYNVDNDDTEQRRSRSSSFFGKSRSRSNTETSNNRKSFFSSSKSPADNDTTEPVHGDFAWKIHEIEGKKKRRGVLEIGNNKIYLDIENKLDEEWPIRNLTNYNNEKKHIFLDFKSPSYSFELYVANRDSANAIISILGDMKGLQSESALKEVKKAHNTGVRQASMKSGRILYDFIGQGGDELTVLEGDKVSIVNDRKSKDWWLVESASGDRGVVPANYVKLTDDKKSKESSSGFMKSLFTGSNSKSPRKRVSDKEERLLRQNARVESEKEELARKQRELERKEKELIAKDREQRERIRRADEKLREKRAREESKRSRSESNSSNSNKLPNQHRVRTWIDRSGSFKVEAEFLGLQEGKIHLHKINGVKIAVAANKLSSEDLEYVERLTGTSLDKYKPKPKSSEEHAPAKEENEATPNLPSRSGVTQKQKALPISAKLVDYWFNFFVESGVDVAVCERYSRNFASEQVDENILSEITPALMRTLGVKEGDILRVKRFIDIKLGRSVSPEPMLPAATGTVPPPPPGIGTKSTDPLPPMPSASLMDDSWATKPASKVNDADKITPQITGSIKDLLDVKPMEPTKTGITPVKPVSNLPGETVGQLKDVQTGNKQQMMPMTAMPTGFMPITMIPMMTGALTGGLTGGLTSGLTGGFATGALSNGLTGGAMRTGGIIPITSFGMPSAMTGGINNLYAAPQQQQKTGGFIMPLNTGAQMPQTSFGVNNGMVKLQPTGVVLQKTGGNIPSMQPTMKTGGFMPQSSFGMQMTGGIPQTSFGMPQTSFGNAAMTGGMPQTSFVNPALTGGLPQTSFGNPAMTGGFQQPFGNAPMNGGFPQASFGQQPMNGGYQQPIQQQAQFGGMNPSMTGGFPQTSFGQPQQQNVPLQSQPTGFGFGNGTGKQANLANATADNPFGF